MPPTCWLRSMLKTTKTLKCKHIHPTHTVKWAAVTQAAKATAQLLLLAAVCLPAFANIPRTPLVAEKPHLGSVSFALASHRAEFVANALIAPGLPGCLYDSGTRPCCSSKERDAETGLDWFEARYFSGAQGRFTSPDKPFADQFPEDPQSWNLYSYVRNNPLKMVDEDGQSATLIGALGGGIIGAGVAAWRGESVWKGAASGAIAGAVAGSVIDTGGASLGVLALSGAAGGLTGGIVSRGLNGEGTTLQQAAVDAAVGGTVGVVLGAGGKAVSGALSKSAPAVAEGASAVSPRVQGIANQIEEGGFKVTANPKTPNQTGNVTITHPNEPGVKLNLRSETHPLPGSGGRSVPHVNVEKVTARTGTTPRRIDNEHITQ